MTKRANAVTFQGQGLTLVGPELQPGQPAPSFTLLGNDLSEVTLGDLKGKVLVISAVPSLDTGVCDMETRRFNELAGQMGQDVKILTVSTDLPFAQARWCGAAGVDAVQTLSDHRTVDFGQAYGVLIEELRLLARCIFVVDREGVITYVQLVKEITEEPDYDAVLQAVGQAAK